MPTHCKKKTRKEKGMFGKTRPTYWFKNKENRKITHYNSF